MPIGVITGTDFEGIGRALFGRKWRAGMADALGKSQRTIKNYLRGRRGGGTNIPKPVRTQIAMLLDVRIAELDALRANLSGKSEMKATTRRK